MQVTRQRLPTDWRKRLQVVHRAAADAQRNLQPSISSQLLAQPGATPAGPDAPQLDYFCAREVNPLALSLWSMPSMEVLLSAASNALYTDQSDSVKRL